MLKKKNIEPLTRARATIREIQQQLSAGDDFGEGRLMQACEDADHAIFQVLILADIYGLAEDGEVHEDALFPLRAKTENKSTGSNGNGKEN
jgi:hypothetical protein